MIAKKQFIVIALIRIQYYSTILEQTTKRPKQVYTDNNGRVTFAVQVGPKSDAGIYNTELEVIKNSYQSSFEQIDFRVVQEKP